jgi:ribose transport system substrate-binding protein
MRTKKFGLLTASLLAGGLLLSGCQGAAAPEESGGDEKPLSIGFFGFAAVNGFAQGTFLGVEEAAADNGATATFVDGAFDAQQQVQQVRDAITSKQFDVIIIQANDNLALQAPLQEAADAGISVVVQYGVVGPDFSTVDPQIDGAISIVELPADNGERLGELGLQACEQVDEKPCKVAYLEGFKALPLDNARTEAVKATLETDSDVELVASVEGGYSADAGRTAFQNVLQADPDVDVVIGSSQAITGAYEVAGPDSGILFIGNGASQPNVDAVRNGDWFAVFFSDVPGGGAEAANLGLAHARGETVETAIDIESLTPEGGLGTKEVLDKLDWKANYSD